MPKGTFKCDYVSREGIPCSLSCMNTRCSSHRIAISCVKCLDPDCFNFTNAKSGRCFYCGMKHRLKGPKNRNNLPPTEEELNEQTQAQQEARRQTRIEHLGLRKVKLLEELKGVDEEIVYNTERLKRLSQNRINQGGFNSTPDN